LRRRRHSFWMAKVFTFQVGSVQSMLMNGLDDIADMEKEGFESDRLRIAATTGTSLGM